MTIGGPDRKSRTDAPTEQVIVDLPVRTIRVGLGAVETGKYASFAEMTNHAILELLAPNKPVEARDGKHQGVHLPETQAAIPTLKGAATVGGFPKARQLGSIEVRTSPPVDIQFMATPLMPFTVQKLWPGKLGLRETSLILGSAGVETIPLGELSNLLGARSTVWADVAVDLDEESGRPRGMRLASNLPREGAGLFYETVKRYITSTVGQIYLDGRVTGSLPFLGFTYLAQTEDGPVVGVTEQGLRFARMENPVADDGQNVYPPFSEEERSFLLDQIPARCPSEAAHMAFYIAILRETSGIGRLNAARKMKSFYERYWNPLSLTNAMVDTLRGGVNSRCLELGLATTNRSGNEASYLATELGLRWLEHFEIKTKSG